MPEGVSFVDYFGLDHIGFIGADNSPQYEVKTIKDTEDHIIFTTQWGVTARNWKHAASTPEFLNFTIVDRESWNAAKTRITPTKDRVDWKYLTANYPNWVKSGYWIQAGLWFGFDVTHAWAVGTERLLCALAEDPEWCKDIFSHELETNLALFDMIWDAGYHFDCVSWPDDMGYKGHQFFSLPMYREVIKPFHQRAIDWAHQKGIKAYLHSCGDVNPFVPELVAMGLDALNPLEVKAGMNPIQLKQNYGDKLVFQGGINAILWDKPEEIKAEMERVVPVMKQHGGYIFSSDHSVPSSVSLEDFRQIVSLAKQLGSY